jgi:hypothetical protein
MRIERDNTFSIAICFCPLSRVVERLVEKPRQAELPKPADDVLRIAFSYNHWTQFAVNQ